MNWPVGGLVAVALTACPLALAFACFRPRQALTAYVMCLYLVGGITNERVRTFGLGTLFTWVPSGAGYVADLLLAALLVSVLARCLVRLHARPGRFDLLVILLFVTAGASWLLNGGYVFTVAAALRLLVQMVAGYFILRYGAYDLTALNRVFWFLLSISILQFPLAVFERFVGNHYMGWGDDLVAGTFSRYPKLVGYQMVFFACGLASLLVRTDLGRWRFPLLLALVCAVGSMALSNSRIAFLFMPLVVVIIFWRHIVPRSWRVLKAGVAAGCLVGVALYTFVYLYGGAGSGGGRELLWYMQNPPAVYSYFFGSPEEWERQDGGRLRRGTAIVYLWQNLPRFGGGLLLGAGPGSATEFKYEIAAAGAVDELTRLGVNVTQAGAMLSEYGLAGAGLSLLLIGAAAGLRLGRGVDLAGPVAVVIGRAYAPILVVFLLLQFYGRVWYETETAFLFWFVTVYLIKAKEHARRARASISRGWSTAHAA